MLAEAIEMNDLDPIEETNKTPPEDEEASLIDDDNPLNTSVRVMRRAFVHEKKNFLKEALKVNLNKRGRTTVQSLRV